MTDQLFPTEPYLDGQQKAPRTRTTYPCCKPWAQFIEQYPDLDQRPWTVLHKLAHSRVGFTERHFALTARVHQAVARIMCIEARERKWIKPGELDGPVPEGAGTMWVGMLVSDR